MSTLARRTLAVWLFVLLLGAAGKAWAAETQLATEGGSFTPTVDMVVRYCGGSTCSAPRTIAAGTLYRCDNSTWGDVTPGIVKECRGEPVAPPAPPPVNNTCYPLNPLAYEIKPVPAAVSTRYPSVAVFKDTCTDTLKAQFFNEDEFKQLAAFILRMVRNGLIGAPLHAAIKEWRAAQPHVEATDAEEAFRATLLPPPPQQVEPPPPAYRVLPDGTKPDRPVYRLRADGTRNTTAVSGVRVPVGTLCGQRYGVTNYFSVKGQPSTAGSVIAEDLYAICGQ